VTVPLIYFFRRQAGQCTFSNLMETATSVLLQTWTHGWSRRSVIDTVYCVWKSQFFFNFIFPAQKCFLDRAQRKPYRENPRGFLLLCILFC